jgi:hypothetical protein
MFLNPERFACFHGGSSVREKLGLEIDPKDVNIWLDLVTKIFI